MCHPCVICPVQAEVNLVFNQLLFDLEAEVFGYFKDWAASTVLDKTFKRVYEIRRGWGHFIPGRRRYEVRHGTCVCPCARVLCLRERLSVAFWCTAEPAAWSLVRPEGKGWRVVLFSCCD